MKTITTILIAILLPSIASAQVIFSENFNSANSLNNWTLVNADNATPVLPQFNAAWIKLVDSSATDSSVASTSWYNPADTADDWLISPQISLTSNNILRFDAKANDPNFPDGYEVRISTTTLTLSAFLSTPSILTISASDPIWTTKYVNLDSLGYSNQNVYLAWRNTSYDSFILNIDNIIIETQPRFDIELVSVNNVDSFYTQIPQSQNPEAIFGATVKNLGSSDVNGVTLKYDLIDIVTNTPIHTDSIVFAPTLFSNGSVDLVSAPYPITNKGFYSINYELKMDSTDANLSNNRNSTETFRTDSTLARSTDVPQVVLGINGFKSEFASTFVLKNPDTLTTVTVIRNNNNGIMNGRPLSATVRNFNGQPTSLIAASDTITFNSIGPAFVDFTFRNNGGFVPLTTGTFVVGIVQYDSALTLGATNDIFVSGTQWVNSAIPGINNQWTLADQVGINYAGMIYPNFGTPNVITSIEELQPVSKSRVYPNPTNGSLNVMVINEHNALLTYTVRDLAGKEVLKGSFNTSSMINEEVDLNTLANGVYLFQVEFNDHIESIKVIKQ